MSRYNKIRIGIIDLKINNIYSIYNVFKNIGYKTNIINKSFNNYDFIILPGVGSFREGMDAIKKKLIIDELKESVFQKNKKLIGICLGMQLLFSNSEEYGLTKGLDLIKGNVKKFNRKKNFTIPMVGWYKIKSVNKNLNDNYFYHIHSYYCMPSEKNTILAKTEYEKFSYCSSVQQKNILAFQFHPEKSGKNGINLLKKIPLFFS